jgi:gliding motility-associated-like protein
MLKKALLVIIILFQTLSFGQLGFCSGSSGAPIFFENFGSGTTYGPALPTGITNYNYVSSGFPNDGQYTLYYRTNLIPNNWLYSLDHTPDNQPDGIDGKCLIVNASNTPGQFYKRTVTGLCSNTTFEFSAWVINIINSASGGCPGTGIPVNVSFEIWDVTDTILLQSGSTGNINGTPSPIWNQYGLVFTMGAGQTSVILKMRNNGAGGCGNDLAIDDIMFRACGEFSSITKVATTQNTMSVCENETITTTTLQVTTTGTGTNVYQWQQSNDNVNYTDIAGANASLYTIPSSFAATTYYRAKVASDVSNLNNPYCSTLSEIFTVNVKPLPNVPISIGSQSLCSNQTAILSVSVNTNESVNWYDAATTGNLVRANSLTYSPTTAGTYYAEAYNVTTGCKSGTRTAVILIPITTITSTGTTTICSGITTAINLVASDTNATINWTATSSNVTGFSNGTGNTIAQTLTYSGNATGTVTYTITPIKNGCAGTPKIVVVTVNPQQNITLTFPTIPTNLCLNTTAPLLPNMSSNPTPISGTWTPSTINTAAISTTIYTFNPVVGICQNILPYQVTITVGSNIMPNFAPTVSLCSGTTPPILNPTSPNGIAGTWFPPTINNTTSGNYTFTPNTNQCAVNQTINVTVTTLTVSSSGPTSICSGETTAITLLASDTNATINWTATSSNVVGFSNGSGNTIAQTLTCSGNTIGTVTYTITATKNSCVGTPKIVVITVNPPAFITPTFPTIPTTLCINDIPPILPNTSSNTTPINGTWSPAIINTASINTTVYTFNPQVSYCQNIQPYQISITVGNNFMPDFDTSIQLCSGTTPPLLNTTSPNGITGTWNPSTINNSVSASYLFTPNANQCADNQTINVTILESNLTSISYTTTNAFSENQIVTIFALAPGNYAYQLDNGVLQENNVFENVASGTHTIKVIDQNGCDQPITDEIIIIGYPSFFTPNGDGFNEYWTISNLSSFQKPVIRIFNRYGNLIKQIASNGNGWDGTFNGIALPADDYWFTVDFIENNQSKTFKSHFSIKR